MERRRRPAALGLLASGVLLLACGGDRLPEVQGRVLIVGIDGASPRVVDPMLRDGRLPNLAAIARAGARGRLRASKPISSPRIWNTIVTGKPPREHGILDFSHRDAAGAPVLFLSTDRKVPALWNIANAAGLRAGVVNFWNTYPPERIRGVMVSDHVLAKEVEGRRLLTGADAAPEGTLVYPPEWHARIAALAGEATPPVAGARDPFRAEGLPRWLKRDELSRRWAVDGALARMALAIEEALHPDLLMLLLPGIDRVSHYLWGVMEPPDLYPEGLRPSDAERVKGLEALHAYYAYTDALIGLLVARFGPEDLVMVLSDHGFEPGVSLGVLTGAHESDAAIDGVLLARGRGIPAGTRATGMVVADVTPTVLAWWGLPVGRDMAGRPAAFLSDASVPTIASHDGVPVEHTTAAPSGLEAEIVEELRSLGYIEN